MKNNRKKVEFKQSQTIAKFYERVRCKALCHKYNSLSPNMISARLGLSKQILGETKSIYLLEQPFMCDYGYNIKIGENFYSNHNLIILDAAPVTFGDNVLIGPNCSFYTPLHPFDPDMRKEGYVSELPITVGNNVWIGGNVTVLPGVTIGDNSIIGAGSLVTKDVPSNVLAVGSPCKVVQSLCV